MNLTVSSVSEDADLSGPAVGVTLEPVSFGEVWRRLTGLLPGVGNDPP